MHGFHAQPAHLDALKKAAKTCDGRKLPKKLSEVILWLQQEATATAKDVRGACPDDIESFRDLLRKTKKMLTILGKDRRNPEPSMEERLQKSLKELQTFHYRVQKGDRDAVMTVSGVLKNATAKKFWSESFESKVGYTCFVQEVDGSACTV